MSRNLGVFKKSVHKKIVLILRPLRMLAGKSCPGPNPGTSWPPSCPTYHVAAARFYVQVLLF